MATNRMLATERRVSIIEAAVPLFARRGFVGTTTKEIASAACVSEALLFKHFPTKASLYQEIVASGCLGDPELEKLTRMPPCTRTLVQITCGMLAHFVLHEGLVADIDRADHDARLRLIQQSILGDGEYARSLYAWVMDSIYPTFAAAFVAAAKSGDLGLAPLDPKNAFWFAEHVASSIGGGMLPPSGCVPYAHEGEALVAQAARFVLRGFGLREDVISAELAAERDNPFFGGVPDAALRLQTAHLTPPDGGISDGG